MNVVTVERVDIDEKDIARRQPAPATPHPGIDGLTRVECDGQAIMLVAQLDRERLTHGRAAALAYAKQASTTYRASGIRNRSRTFGFLGPAVTMRRDGCRACNGATEATAAHATLCDLSTCAACMMTSFHPEQADHARQATEDIDAGWKLGHSWWTSGVLNIDSAMPYHRDGNNVPGVWSAMLVLRRGIEGGHLHLPEFDLTVPLHDGDVIMFPGADLWHGVTPIEKKTRDAYRMTAVFYAVAGMTKCGEAEHEAATTARRRTEREGEIAAGLNTPSRRPAPGRPDGAVDVAELAAGMDFRRPEHRRETFLRFYEFHLENRAHPGAVYYVLPHLRETFGWDDETALWFAFLNGHTQNPVTSLTIWRRWPDPRRLDGFGEWFAREAGRLAFDTDRRHHKPFLPAAAEEYAAATGGDQAGMWRRARAGGWAGVWEQARSLRTFGRLSAFSFAEYLHVLGFGVDTDTLYLDDRAGSRSHRNGLSIVLGRDDLDWHGSNPTFDGEYPPDVIEWLEDEAATLLAEARARLDHPDVGYFTLESALCTYKSWHRPNRRYPNVYNDLLHDRIRWAEERWPTNTFDVLWEARAKHLPERLRLEDRPHDPGCVPVKQNHYRETGQVVMMDTRWACFANDLDRAIDAGETPRREP